MNRGLRVMASVAVTLAIATPARAQGNGKGTKNQAAASSPLPGPTVVVSVPPGAAPFAWIDDASVLPDGAVAVSASVLRWQGTDLSEVYAPVVGVSAGLTPRLQMSLSMPRVVGDDVSGVVGGLGTTYFGAKIAVLTRTTLGIKVAVAPTIEILGAGTLQPAAAETSRTQFGLPASIEIDRGVARVFASAGFFTQGVRFAGGGVAAQATPRVSVSAAFSLAWTTNPINGIAEDRREISGGAAFSPRPALSLFGSLGRTIATADQAGAGTTLSGGVMFLISPPVRK